MIGEKLGHYEITAKIGKGGMGVVYRASDTLIGRDVALKTIHLNEIEDPNERQFLKERLFREAKSAGILSHPNIVTVYQIGEQDGLTYIAMEFVDGLNLGEILARPERPGMDLLLSVFEQTAGALDYAHSRGVVHRDIKPGNIIVREDGVAKIADFGVAKISSQNVTRAGMALGTPHYMSPEQFHGRAIDGRSDQYSLAVMVYEILTGKKPFTADSIHGLMYKILHEDAQPRRDNPDISEGVDAALRRALAKEPDKRYPSCSAFIEDLRNLSGILPTPFSVESGLRTSSSGSSTLRPGVSTPMPSPVPPPSTASSTPGSGVATPPPTPPGLPPPPLPASQATPIGFETGRSSGPPRPESGGFVPPPAGQPTPSSGVNVVSGTGSIPPRPTGSLGPPPPGSGSGGVDVPTPAAGSPTSGFGGTSSTPPQPPVPPAPAGQKTGAAVAAKSPVKSGQSTGKPSSKTPLIVAAAVVVVLLIAVVGIIVMMIPSAESDVETVAETTPPVIEAPTFEPEPPPIIDEEPGEEVPEAEAAPEAKPTPPPMVASFIADPVTINQGESAKLRWSTSNTSYVQIEPGLSRGRSVGEHTVTPAQTTKYTLIARGLGGRRNQEVTITVVPRQAQQPTPGSTKPNAWSLDALTRALEAGEDVVKMDNLMVRVGLNGVSFAVTSEAQSAILAAGERGNRPRDAVVRLVDLAKQGGRR
jgi:eukaryotic-like serine/threonine-protein kinase